MKSAAERTRERIKQNQQKHAAGGRAIALPDDFEWLDIGETMDKKGTICFSILPYRVNVSTHPDAQKGEEWYVRTYFMHRDVGPEGAQVICPKTVGKPCPICEEQQRMWKDPNLSKEDEEAAKSLRAKERQLFNVLVEGEDTIKILDVHYANRGRGFGEMLEAEVNRAEEYAFWTAKEGKLLRVVWNEQEFSGHAFYEPNRIDFEDRDPIHSKLAAATLDLDSVLNILDYDTLKKMFLGLDEADEKASAEDDESPKKPSKPDREDDDGDAVDKAEDKDEAPKSKGAKCIACQGSGKNSKGRTCLICDGTGKKDDEEDDLDMSPSPKAGKTEKAPAEDDESPKKPSKPAKDADDDDWDDDDDKSAKKTGGLTRGKH